MYNPEQYYEVHMQHLKDLHKEADQIRMIAAFSQRRHARLHTAGRQLGVVLVRLGTWLARAAPRDQQPA
jgi:hypothetical protein